MMDTFAFDGGQISARQLKQQCPVYSEGMLQSALESGCKSVAEVMTHLAGRDYRRQATRVKQGKVARAMHGYRP